MRFSIYCTLFLVAVPESTFARSATVFNFMQNGHMLGTYEDSVPVPDVLEAMQAHITSRSPMGKLNQSPQPEEFCAASYYSPAWWLAPEVELRRAAHFQFVSGTACEFSLPTKLLDAVITQESGYNTWAISRAGAMGLAQIMPGTARTLGLRDPFDPIANLRAGARYLRQQLDRFGRVDLALAAYNAGPERRSLKYGRIPAIPETQHYVRTILTNWGRLIELDQANAREPDRGELAMVAVRASGYRDVELIRYDGSNASNPM